LAMLGSTAGSVLGPLAGGALYDFGGYTFPFYITLGMVGLDALFRIFLLPKDKGVSEKSPDLRGLLFDKGVLVAALAVAVAAAGWGIIEPLLPTHLIREGTRPSEIGFLFTISTIVYGCFAPIVAWFSERFSIKRVITFGIIGLAISLPLLSLSANLFLVGLFLSLVSISYAFVLNPTSAELGNAVDRRGMSCYAAVYAVYNIAYSLGMMSSDAFASSAGGRMSFQNILLCMSGMLLLCVPLIIKGMKEQKEPGAAPALQR
jgi:DHA1 family solute carrier family 18 vesicular amine transporter 1/2